MSNPALFQEKYWDNFQIQQEDIDFIYNYLLEIEKPQTPRQILTAIIQYKIDEIKKTREKEINKSGVQYLPSNNYEIGQSISFPTLEWQAGNVESVREGFNPDFQSFNVINMIMDNGEKRSFASGLEKHKLNHLTFSEKEESLGNPEKVIEIFGEIFTQQLETYLEKNDELVKIAGSWFPKCLLVDINNGHLNLTEAVLEEVNGEPLSTQQIIDLIELKSDSNHQLTEFSLNYALQEDNRFDEVGPAGEVLWCLRELEPEDVRNVPIYLRYDQSAIENDKIQSLLSQFEGGFFDELENWGNSDKCNDAIIVSIIYPHWQSGTLPLSQSLVKLFPTAFESERVRFTFIDQKNKKRFPGWVIRSSKYVTGLTNWYKTNGLIPGSLVTVRKGENPGEIIIESEKCRQSREWIHTALMGSDKRIVIGMLKQNISTTFNERMAIAVPDPDSFNEKWERGKFSKEETDKLIFQVMRELSKLNPQVHAQELYATTNVILRCPPSVVLNFLITNPEVSHLGDLYFRINEVSGDQI